MDTCPITGYPFAWFNHPTIGSRFEMLPPVGTNITYKFGPVGQVSITHQAVVELDSKLAPASRRSFPWHPVLAGLCRNNFEEGKPPYQVTVDIVNQLASGSFDGWYPKTFDEKRDHFLRYLLKRENGETTTKGPNFYLGSETLTYGSSEDFRRVIVNLEKLGFIQWESYSEEDGYGPDYTQISLTSEGTKEATKLKPKPDPFAAPDRLVSTGDAALDTRLNHARQLFFKPAATTDDLRSACETLSHILEPLRKDPELLAVVTSDDDVDNFFRIVNAFDVRHNKPGTMKLKHNEQYEWVFNSLLNTIIIYAKLKNRLSGTTSAPVVPATT